MGWEGAAVELVSQETSLRSIHLYTLVERGYRMPCKDPCGSRARALRRSAILLATLTLAFAFCASAAYASSDETTGDTFGASVTPSGVYANANAIEKNPSISADGRYVAFVTSADNLGEHGPVGVQEAYVKDLHTGEVKLVSRASGPSGEPANEPGEGSGVEFVFISGNGRYVVFTSAASNLVSGLPANEPGEHPLHVYRRDLQTGETVLVDRVTGSEGAILAERTPRAEGISADGRYVLFRDGVEDLEDPADSHEPGTRTVYVRDVQAGTTTAVSRASGADGELAGESSSGNSISPNGRYVAFESSATNLIAGMESNTVSQVYLRDLQTNTTTLLSRTPTGEPGNGSSEEPILIGDEGCHVAFSSQATNLYLFEAKPVLTPEAYLADLCSTPASITLVSRADGQNGAPAAEGNSVIPAPLGASADGRYILFSAFSDLTGEPNNARSHLYVRDLTAGTTSLVDREDGTGGEAAKGNPEGAALSANGCRLAFTTQAYNLGEPLLREVYIRQLAPCNEEPTVTPASVSLGTQPLETIGPPHEITVTAGSEEMRIRHLQMQGPNSSDFILTADECTGEMLQPGETCTFAVRFTPSATGPRSASLTVGTDTPTSLQVTLSGEGGTLPTGERGPIGETGKGGATGQQGPVGGLGTQGKAGARGLAGRAAKVTCHVAKSARKIACSVTLEGTRMSRDAHARLTKNGRTYALGSLRSLRLSRTLRSGVYTLTLTSAGHTVTIPVSLG